MDGCVIEIAGIVIGAVALFFSVWSFFRSRRIQKIVNYLQFGTPEKIDLEIAHAQRRSRMRIREITERTKRDVERTKEDFGRRGLYDSGPMKAEIKKIREGCNNSISEVREDTEHNIRLLQMKAKELLGL